MTESEIEHHFSMPTSFSDDNLIYKYQDENTIAVAAVDVQTSSLLIQFVNTISGKVIYQYTEPGIALDKPYDMLITDNIFVLAFQRILSNGLTQQELTVTEFFQPRQEDNTY
jgi:hypothetical protein